MELKLEDILKAKELLEKQKVSKPFWLWVHPDRIKDLCELGWIEENDNGLFIKDPDTKERIKVISS